MDDQLGYLMTYLLGNIFKPFMARPIWDKDFSNHLWLDKEFTDINIIEDFIDLEIANEAREFCQNIMTISNSIPNILDLQIKDFCKNGIKIHYNDDGNIKITEIKNPKDGQASSTFCKVHKSEWMWNIYKPGILRGSPRSLISFVISPIYDLVLTLVLYIYKVLLYSHIKDEIPKLHMETIVLQKSLKGEKIDWHYDDYVTNTGFRRVSFIYYLTNDNWCEDDGGLFVTRNNRYIPKFNNLIMWINPNPTGETCDSLKTLRKIPHKTTKLKTDKDRLAIVGFLWKHH